MILFKDNETTYNIEFIGKNIEVHKGTNKIEGDLQIHHVLDRAVACLYMEDKNLLTRSNIASILKILSKTALKNDGDVKHLQDCLNENRIVEYNSSANLEGWTIKMDNYSTTIACDGNTFQIGLSQDGALSFTDQNGESLSANKEQQCLNTMGELFTKVDTLGKQAMDRAENQQDYAISKNMPG